MDQKRVLKDILDLCKQAKFKESMDIMCLIDGEISNKWIMAIIIGCCNTCVDNISHLENISEDYLFSFFKHVVLCIKDVNEAELLSYLQSLFYILKIFIKKVKIHIYVCRIFIN